ncbi:MAG: DUF5127 domain-containing protein [Streptosporangiaceae bacterium]|nr:DUF5127 domain-containing protein [Streptosporangiaceae bacterium]
MDRRDFLRYSGAAVAGVGVAGATTGIVTSDTALAAPAAAITPAAGGLAPDPVSTDPIRPPAAPLAVRGPYLSTWLPATTLPGTWPQFWTGHITAMAGIARVDGVSYMFMGAPTIVLDVPNGNSGSPSTVTGFEHALRQTLLEVTATRSRFHLVGGGISLTAEFFSPVEPGDPRRQSIPMSYLVITVHSIDGQAHDVQLYADISGEWTSGDVSQVITWAPYSDSSLRAWTVQLRDQHPLTEQGQLAAWGTVVWSAPAAGNLTYQSGQDIVVRGQFVANGSLTNGNDTNYRAISDNWPVFAFCADLGRVGGSPVTVPLSIGQVRTPAVSYLGQTLQPLWTSYFSSWQDMAGFFHADLASARRRADALDARVNGDARASGGPAYAGLCAISLRQAYGGTELVAGPGGQPWALLKEISSDGNVSTVDVMYPASPAWVYADPAYLGLLLEPLLAYAETGGWPKTFAEHDLGSAYPVASGHNNGAEEDMPVEESGNMLIMTAAYLKKAPASAKSFATAHYKILKQWADYLVVNLPDPGFQNQTDDFAGSIAHSVNLALKGIVAVAAMAQIAAAAGNTSDATHYQGLASQFIGYWLTSAQDPSGKHLDLTYNGSGGGNGTWGTTYNAYADRLLRTGLVPASVAAEQAAWYQTVRNQFGLPLQIPHSYAKSDWELFTAAWLSAYPIKQQLIDDVYTYASTTPSRVAFSDLYDTINGQQVAFQARPVQGGIFALLALR